MNEWILSDADGVQAVQNVEGSEWQVLQIVDTMFEPYGSQYALKKIFIDLDSYLMDDDFATEYLKPFGYDSVDNVRKMYAEFSDQIIAEWLCLCSYGNKKTVSSACLLAGHTQSCGCIKSSVGEDKIKALLVFFDVEYQTEYSFENLKSNKGAPLRFDFALFSKEKELLCLVEYQGIQHFRKNNYGFGDVQREKTDILKREFCLKENIPLIEIAYDEDAVDKICNVVNYFVYHVNPVPSSNAV